MVTAGSIEQHGKHLPESSRRRAERKSLEHGRHHTHWSAG
jgi:hypothetical protein